MKKVIIHDIKVIYNPLQSYKTININNCIRIKSNRIRLPKVGWIKFRTQQKIKGTIKSVTVRKNPSGKYTLSILCDDIPNKLFKRNNRYGLRLFALYDTSALQYFGET